MLCREIFHIFGQNPTLLNQNIWRMDLDPPESGSLHGKPSKARYGEIEQQKLGVTLLLESSKNSIYV